MHEVDWTPPAEETPGVKHLTVTRAEMRSSKSSGEPMIVLTLRESNGAEYTDYLSLTGKGKGMALGKLKALGVPEGTKDVIPLLRNIECWAMMKAEEFKGRTNLRVDVSASEDGWKLGYRLDPPKGWEGEVVPF